MSNYFINMSISYFNLPKEKRDYLKLVNQKSTVLNFPNRKNNIRETYFMYLILTALFLTNLLLILSKLKN